MVGCWRPASAAMRVGKSTHFEILAQGEDGDSGNAAASTFSHVRLAWKECSPDPRRRSPLLPGASSVPCLRSLNNQELGATRRSPTLAGSLFQELG